MIGLTVKKDLSHVPNINPIALRTVSLSEIGLKSACSCAIISLVYHIYEKERI